jgi:UDP-N-acetylmuramoyl-tripeptide--D-alanyl-D-alanine ligase
MTPPLWTYSDLVTLTDARLIGVPSRIVFGVSINSRTVAPGDLFVAIKGENFDGHSFARAAIEAGAAIAMIAAERQDELGRQGPFLSVRDPLAALVKLGIASRNRSSARIGAVTGSVGKTGTKEMLAAALRRSGETHAAVASYNNHWGVPLTLARMPVSSQYGVFEIGMNHAGEILPLVSYVRPHVAIITTVEPVHLEFFPNVEAIADAKAEIITGIEPGGAILLNRDNAHFERLKGHADAHGVRVVTFGAHPDADCRLLDCALQTNASSVSATVFGAQVTYKLGAPGRHIVQNSLAVLGAASLLGADLALAALALADIAAPEGRGERSVLPLPRGGVMTLIDESYNANPASMRAAIELLGAIRMDGGGRRIAVLGDMRELGPNADALHAGLAPAVEAAKVDIVYACGPHMRQLWEALPDSRRGAYAEAAVGLEAALLEAVAPGDVVMVKGSLGSRMGPIVDAFKTRFRAADAPPEGLRV